MYSRSPGDSGLPIGARGYPLSQGQKALWFLQQVAPGAVAYNLAGAAAIPGDTNLGALEEAFRRLAERQPMLRSTFAAPGGEPVQRIHSRPEVAFECEDASAWNPSELEERIASAIYLPYDLELGPLWRVYVFRAAPIARESAESSNACEHLILLTLHHLVGDLWSVAVLMSELAALYHEEVTGVPAALPPLRVSYADYVQQEKELLAGPRAEASWHYWRSLLEGAPTSLNLPTDRRRPPVRSDRGATHSIMIDRELADRLRALAEARGVPLYVAMLAALQTLLYRYTAQIDVLVGFPKAGRKAATARVIGYFVNPIVVRADFSGEPSFLDVLLRTQRAIAESAEHDWYPFPVLVSRLRPARDLSHPPLVQVMFSWQHTTRLIPRAQAGALALGQAGHQVDLGGLSIRPVPIPRRSAAFDLAVSGTEVPDGLAVTVEYSTDLFDEPTIARLAECYRTLLDRIATMPEQAVSRLAILPAEERRRLLVDWNATAAPFPELCLHQLFEAQAKRWPDIMAATCRQEGLTYRQLDQRANRLSQHLLEQGIAAGSVVGLCCEPSLETIIGVLGILKAGAAYLPLDPGYPPDRLAFMLGDAGAAALVTHARVRDRVTGFAGAIIDLDAGWPVVGRSPDHPPPALVTPDAPAYIIFTSGSTGRPKGVALAHRGVVNLLTDCQERQPIAPGDACSWWTSISFDVSVYEIFSALLAGGTLHVIPDDLRLDVPALFDWLHTRRVRHAYLPPFLLPDFAAWLRRRPDRSELRRLLVGVEPIPEALLHTIAAQVPGLRIINGYGPSETTICSTLYNVEATRPAHSTTPIGRAVRNTRIYLLDGQMQPAPRGVTGEIYIGGVGLAGGYLNRPDLSAERFISNPFAPEPGSLLYRTGDRARYLPDGNLEFLGRCDDQCKVHGVRIEPAEIEATLARHPAVRSAAVTARLDQRGDNQLVAYVVPSEDTPPSPRELRRYLAQFMPEYMVPSVYIMLDALPLTPSGKLDRRALPAPAQHTPKAVPLKAPRSDIEEILLGIWRRVLGTEAISVDDNFFELGGDSIVGMQIISEAVQVGLRLSPRDLFRAPTVAGLAAVARASAGVPTSPAQSSVTDDLPLTPIQHWFFEHNFPEPQHWNQALMFYAARPVELPQLRAAVGALIAHHDALRLRFVKGSGGWQQTCAEPCDEVPCEVIDLSAVTEHQLSVAVERSAALLQRSLDLATGPLLRVAYLDLGADRAGRLLIVIHHLAVDGVSWRVLLDDLQTAYGQAQDGGDIRLSPKTTSFGGCTRRLADFAASEQLRQAAAFWSETISGDHPGLPLDFTTDDPISDVNTEASAQHVLVRLNRDETKHLLSRVRGGQGRSVNVTLLAALARAIQAWTNSDTCWIELEGHGREDLFDDVDLSRTVGWFTSLFPVRLQLPSAGGPDKAEDAVADQLQHIPRKGLDYGLLRYLRAHSPETRDLRCTRPPQIVFNYLGQFSISTRDVLIARPAPESTGALRCPDATRPYMLEINAAIIEGELQVEWTYSSSLHRREIIEEVARIFTGELRLLTLGSRLPAADERVLCDIPAAVPAWDKSEVLCQNSHQQQTTGSGSGGVEAVYSLSPMQLGMLFHTLSAPGTGVYFEQVTCTIEGQLDIPAFAGAWQRVLDRHAILRTCFTGEHLDQMRQVVRRDVPLPVDVLDWRPLPAVDQQARLAALLGTDRELSFKFDVPPLWRLTLVRTADGVHRCLFSYHHALLDGWSLGLLFREVLAIYAGLIAHDDVALPMIRPYRDYIAWLEKQELAGAEAFWRAALAGCAPHPLFPERRTLSREAASAPPGELEVLLSAGDTLVLATFAQRGGLTLNTLLQGGWALLLATYHEETEVVFGVTTTGRPPALDGSESMIGLFINTLPLRVHIDPQVPLSAWLHRLQQQAAEARQYDYCPLSQIQRWSASGHGRRLFDTIIVFENYPIDSALQEGRGGLRIADVRAIERTNYALAVAATPGKRMRLKVAYDSRYCDPAFVEGLLGRLCQLLLRMPSDPGLSLGDLIAPLVQGCMQTPASAAPCPPRSEPGHVARQDGLHTYLVRLWGELLHVENVGIQDDFFELGGTSLTGAQLVSRLRQDLSEDVALAAIFEASTVSELATYLERQHSGGVGRLLGRTQTRILRAGVPAEPPVRLQALVPIQPLGSRPPLFCVHPAGGIVFPYYTLARCLGQDQPLYGLQDPSLLDVCPAFQSIEEMAEHYVSALRAFQPVGTYHLMGWSVGGVVAYEMAQQLQRQGAVVAQLILLDTAAPARRRSCRSPMALRGLRSLVASRSESVSTRWRELKGSGPAIASYVRSGLFLLAAGARHRAANQGQKPVALDLLTWVLLHTWRICSLQEAEMTGTIPQDSSLLLEMPAVQRIVSKVRQHIGLALQYTAQPYQGRLVLVRAVEAESRAQRASDLSHGWKDLATAGLEIRTVRANHVALLLQPAVDQLAEELMYIFSNATVCPREGR